MAKLIAVAYFGGSFLAEDMTVEIPGGCTDIHAFMREWIADGHRGCLWYQLGERISGTTSFEDGSESTASKTTMQKTRYYNGGTFTPSADLIGIFRSNMDNWPDAIGGIHCRNGWGQPFFEEDQIMEAVK